MNNDLFKTLENLELAPEAPLCHVVVKAAFTDANNYMKDGILLRQVVNEIDGAVDFTDTRSAMPSVRFTRPFSRTCNLQETLASSIRRAL